MYLNDESRIDFKAHLFYYPRALKSGPSACTRFATYGKGVFVIFCDSELSRVPLSAHFFTLRASKQIFFLARVRRPVGRRRSIDVLLVLMDLSVLHHHEQLLLILQHANVGDRVAVHQQ